MAKKIPKQRSNSSQRIIQLLTRRCNLLTNKLKAANTTIRTNNANNYHIIYRYCPNKIYLKYDRIQLPNNLRKLRRIATFKVNQLKNLLNKLDISKNRPKIAPAKHVNKIINSKMGDKINSSKFLKGVENCVENINKTWPYSQIKTLKSALNNIDYSSFNFESPLSDLKVDSFIDLLLIPENDFKVPNDPIQILGVKNCTKIPLINGIKFIEPKTKNEIIFNKDFIKKKITTNIGILNAYYKMLQKFTDTKHLELNELINKINNIIDSTSIYFCDMPINDCGLTISNGNIYIAGEYLYEALGETREYKKIKNKDEKIYYKFESICKIYLTLLHEFAHKLHYLVRKKQLKNEEWKNNYFDHSEEINFDTNLEYYTNLNKGAFRFQTKKNYTSFHKNNKIEESGNFFDRELYVGKEILAVNDDICEFFLSNRCNSYDNYKKTLKRLLKNHSKIANINSHLRFKKTPNFSRCYFSNLRNNY